MFSASHRLQVFFSFLCNGIVSDEPTLWPIKKREFVTAGIPTSDRANNDDSDTLMYNDFSVQYDHYIPHSMVVQSTNEWIHAVPE